MNYDEGIGLHEFLVQYDKRLSEPSAIFVPIKNKKIIKTETKAWYDDRLREHKRSMRERGKSGKSIRKPINGKHILLKDQSTINYYK